MSVGNRVRKAASLAAVPAAVLLVAACSAPGQGPGSDQEAAFAQSCVAQGYEPDGPGWRNCISRQRSNLAAERLPHDTIRWGL